VAELLYSAYLKQGLARQAARDLTGAKESYQQAASIMPDQPAAADKIREVVLQLNTPTPTPSPTPAPTLTPTPTPSPTPSPNLQRIEVDISEQRMYVYDGEELVWDWLTSTGQPGKDTAIGTYAIQSKVAMAYASSWDLDMPWWMGIYNSGPLENGIHGLPTQRANGYKLWEGLLGQPVSYGCVILSDENAETLFNWVQIGTPVIIRW
jgi:lipoprotein-anchoring transpeptidase ErfK/SrfK